MSTGLTQLNVDSKDSEQWPIYRLEGFDLIVDFNPIIENCFRLRYQKERIVVERRLDSEQWIAESDSFIRIPIPSHKEIFDSPDHAVLRFFQLCVKWKTGVFSGTIKPPFEDDIIFLSNLIRLGGSGVIDLYRSTPVLLWLLVDTTPDLDGRLRYFVNKKRIHILDRIRGTAIGTSTQNMVKFIGKIVPDRLNSEELKLLYSVARGSQFPKLVKQLEFANKVHISWLDWQKTFWRRDNYLHLLPYPFSTRIPNKKRFLSFDRFVNDTMELAKFLPDYP
ncbi:MAG: hypothetical protein HQM11_20960 [SAR324 cluster bacterium]|nr:hypothetical protein [SAR324 cluster bacterium]